jgi:release factor glutamine methyltransferase
VNVLRKLLRYIVRRTWKPRLEKKLEKPSVYIHNGIRLAIQPGVFHPRYFYSTGFLLKFMESQPLKDKTFLELGCGSGLIAVAAAKKGAHVTATDISIAAVNALEENAAANGAGLTVIHSDLFRDVPPQAFDLVAVNPPYYKGRPVTEADRAWYCGEQFEFFEGFFEGLGSYLHKGSLVAMVLSEDCDLGRIRSIAKKCGYGMALASKRSFWLSTEMIWVIRQE